MNGARVLEKCQLDDDDLEQYDRSLANEANRVLNDLKFGVVVAEVSDKLDKNDSIAYINLRTLEQKDYCVELTASGYRIVSYAFDSIDEELINNTSLNSSGLKFESYESLMNQISPLFVKKFNDSVAERLQSFE